MTPPKRKKAASVNIEKGSVGNMTFMKAAQAYQTALHAAEKAEKAHQEALRSLKTAARVMHEFMPARPGSDTNRRKSSSSRGAREDYKALQAALVKAMARGKRYAGGDLMKMSGSAASAQTFNAQVRAPLYEAGKIVKVDANGKPAPKAKRGALWRLK